MFVDFLYDVTNWDKAVVNNHEFISFRRLKLPFTMLGVRYTLQLENKELPLE